MRILLAHNFYQQPGGEDEVFSAEGRVLEQHGHEVIHYTADNAAVSSIGRARLARATVWNDASYDDLRKLIRRTRPDVAHFHNTFPLISPAAYYAAHAEGVPVVQTLHNYRLLCPNAMFFRDGRVCEDCLGKSVPWPGVVHACYRGSRAASATVLTMLTTHRAARTWTRQVDVYIALTRFAQQKLIEGGIPADRTVVKPNFVDPDPGVGDGSGGYALFVGRLTPEKGIRTLLTAWDRLDSASAIPLKIVGDGPLGAEVAQAQARNPCVTWLGRKPYTEVLELLGGAAFLVVPSEWYETFGRVVAEALAKGTPVIVANIGAIAELIDHGRTGFHFRPGDPDDLAGLVARLVANEPALARMRAEARVEFEANYTSERNYVMLMDIYHRAIDSRQRASA